MAEHPRAEQPRKEFGRRGQAPPVVTNAPKGLLGGAGAPSAGRKRSIVIALIAAGSLSIGTYAAIENARRRDCAKEGDWERQEECRQSRSGGGHGGGSSSSSSHGSSSSGSSSFSSSSNSSGGGVSGHAVSFGGFGGAGSGHGGGS
ncbi:hypothetical protein IY145_16145 [Methylosinus sp. H3A]|uniref:hypothetical protein n=1 Tax=Methylosinus sp. H3A TaxID=2785786 RepID=UPI0018C25BD7|nr:hypothetical protein [Methylosinus sp. H3A]MBG0810901.1 hypothetical protein [Methylosinus sp. H3A]